MTQNRRDTNRTDTYQDENGNIFFENHQGTTTSSIHHGTTTSSIHRAIKLAKDFTINLTPDDNSIAAAGNTFVQSIILQINSRPEFPKKLPMTVMYYRLIWLNITERLVRDSPFYPSIYDEHIWMVCWEQMRLQGECDVEYINVLMRFGVLHCVGKNAIVFDVCGLQTNKPIFEIKSDNFGAKVDSADVLVLGFDGNNYESLLPASSTDLFKTRYIFRRLREDLDLGTLQHMMHDLECKRNEKIPRECPSVPEILDLVARRNIRINARSRRPLYRIKRKLPYVTKPHDPTPPTSKKHETDPEPLFDLRPTWTTINRTSYFCDKENFQGESSPSYSSCIPPLMTDGIHLAKRYFISLKPGTPNGGNGNCSIESVIDQINSRDCFTEHLIFSSQYYRTDWMKETEFEARRSPFYPGEYSDTEWFEAWARLCRNGEYEIDYFGDLMLIGIMHCVQKNALVFHVSQYRAHGPLVVIRGDHFGREIPLNTPPLVLAYDGAHYESLIPDTPGDVQKTVYIVNQWNNFTGADMHAHLSGLDWFTEQGGVDQVSGRKAENN